LIRRHGAATWARTSWQPLQPHDLDRAWGWRLHLRRRDCHAGSLEGARGHPKLKPPFPAAQGLYRKPTIINNVETLFNVP